MQTSLFTRYNPLGSNPNGMPPPTIDDALASGMLPPAFDASDYAKSLSGAPLVDTSSDAPPSSEGLTYNGPNGPASQLANMPPAQPSMNKDAMAPAGKIPAVGTPPLPTSSGYSDGPAQPKGPPVAPPGLDGAPPPPESQVQQLVSRYNSLTPPTAPGAPKNIFSKIGTGIVMAMNKSPEEKMAMLHPIYTSQVGQYDAQRADIAGRIKTIDDANRVQGNLAAKAESAQDRENKIVENAVLHGAEFQPANQPVKPGMEVLPNPLANNPKYANFQLVRDPNFGKFQVTPEQAELSNGAVKAGAWLPLSQLSTFVQGGIAQGKPTKDDRVRVAAATAKAMGIQEAANEDGTVSVPIALMKEKLAADANANKPVKLGDNTLLELRSQGKTTGIPGIDALSPQEAGKSLQRLKPPPQNTTVNFSGMPGANGAVDPYVQAIANYESPIPAPRGSSPAALAAQRNLMRAVKEANPAYDAKNYQMVSQGLHDFTSGATSKSVDAINTVAGHLQTLDAAASALKNNDVRALNQLANSWGIQMGTQTGNALATYNTIVHRVGPELGKAYGTATEGENKLNQSDFDPAKGPEQLHNAVAASAQLLNGKIGALRHRWDQSVKKYNPSREFDMVSPEAQATFQQLSGGHKSQGQIPAGAKVQHNPATGAVRFSTDGGKTWQSQ